jgi:hypothetical protein
MPTESTMLNERSRPSKANREDVDPATIKGCQPTAFFRIGPKVGPTIGDARDGALAGVPEICS